MIQLRKIISNKGQEFFVPINHLIFTIGIFKLFNEDEETQFSSEELAFMIYDLYDTFDFKTLLNHLNLIFQFSYIKHEKKCLQMLFEILNEKGLIGDDMAYFFYTLQFKELIQSSDNIDEIDFCYRLTNLFNKMDMSRNHGQLHLNKIPFCDEIEIQRGRVMKYTGYNLSAVCEYIPKDDELFEYIIDNHSELYDRNEYGVVYNNIKFLENELTSNAKLFLKTINFSNPITNDQTYSDLILSHADTSTLEWIIDNCLLFNMDIMNMEGKYVLLKALDLLLSRDVYSNNTRAKRDTLFKNFKLLIEKNKNLNKFYKEGNTFLHHFFMEVNDNINNKNSFRGELTFDEINGLMKLIMENMENPFVKNDKGLLPWECLNECFYKFEIPNKK